jgi:hypothetical protein
MSKNVPMSGRPGRRAVLGCVVAAFAAFGGLPYAVAQVDLGTIGNLCEGFGPECRICVAVPPFEGPPLRIELDEGQICPINYVLVEADRPAAIPEPEGSPG